MIKWYGEFLDTDFPEQTAKRPGEPPDLFLTTIPEKASEALLGTHMGIYAGADTGIAGAPVRIGEHGTTQSISFFGSCKTVYLQFSKLQFMHI